MSDVLDSGFVRLIDTMGDDLSIVRAARVSYNIDDVTNEYAGEKERTLLRYLAHNGHESPFEHTSMTFHVKAPLFVTRQWMRHRLWSYNEVSRRYTSENIDFYIPMKFRTQSSENKQASVPLEDEVKTIHFASIMIDQHSNRALNMYNTMIGSGIAREQARMVLPQNMYTRFYATANLRSVAHFYRLRFHSHAQWEIQQYAKAVGELADSAYPNSWRALHAAHTNPE